MGDVDDIMRLLGPGVRAASVPAPAPRLSTQFDTVPHLALDDPKHPYADKIGMVPTASAARFREYDRTPSPELVDSIRQHGIREPLIMIYGQQSGKLQLGEGNHRLAAAQQLGLSHVPVRVIRQTGGPYRNSDVSRQPQPAPVRAEADRHGYVKGDLHPREIGLL